VLSLSLYKGRNPFVCVCVCVNHGGANRNRYTHNVESILHGDMAGQARRTNPPPGIPHADFPVKKLILSKKILPKPELFIPENFHGHIFRTLLHEKLPLRKNFPPNAS